jgi:hypothetical protein
MLRRRVLRGVCGAEEGSGHGEGLTSREGAKPYKVKRSDHRSFDARVLTSLSLLLPALQPSSS